MGFVVVSLPKWFLIGTEADEYCCQKGVLEVRHKSEKLTILTVFEHVCAAGKFSKLLVLQDLGMSVK